MISRKKILPDNPTSLFKYCPIDKHSISSLVKGFLWLAQPRSFNDPFDTLSVFKPSFSDADIAAHLNECARSKGELENFTAGNVHDEREKMIEVLSKMEEAIRTCGVASLSATPFEVLMWSHYADNHRGICIEYERTANNDLGGSACRRVEYSNRRPITKDLSFFQDPEGFTNRILYTKAPCWKYELEWRLVFFSKEPGKLVRERSTDARVRSITFGIRASRSDIQTVRALLKEKPDIQLYQMRTDGNSFDLKSVLLPQNPDLPSSVDR